MAMSRRRSGLAWSSSTCDAAVNRRTSASRGGRYQARITAAGSPKTSRAEQVSEPVDAVDALLAERLDAPAGALAGALERVGEVAADDRHVTDRVRRVVEARLDGAPGLAYPLRHDGEDAICEAMRNPRIEAYAALLPARREASQSDRSARASSWQPQHSFDESRVEA